MRAIKKKIASDLIYSIAGIGLMNVVLQFVVYPFIQNRSGSAVFGSVLYYQGLIAILAPSFGLATNNTRLVFPNRDQTQNGDYISVLALFSLIAAITALVVCILRGEYPAFIIVFVVVMALSVLRNYASVEYRLTLNYRNQFIFFSLLSMGYLAGMGLFFLSGQWIFVLVIGESAALLYVLVRGSIFSHPLERSAFTSDILRSAATLSLSYLLTNMMLNLDRFVLDYLLGPEAVSEYYVLSLLGKTIAIIGNPLNGILIGHITKNNVRLNTRNYTRLCLLLAGFGAVFFGACYIGTPIYIRLMYPTMDAALHLNLIVNAAQIMYFITNILLVVVLTLVDVKWQLMIQLSYSAVFLGLALGLTFRLGILGFAAAAAVSSAFYLLMTAAVGYWGSRKNL